MQLLEFISIDRELKTYLAKNSTPLTGTTSKSKTITNEDLPKVCIVFNDSNIFFVVHS